MEIHILLKSTLQSNGCLHGLCHEKFCSSTKHCPRTKKIAPNHLLEIVQLASVCLMGESCILLKGRNGGRHSYIGIVIPANHVAECSY